MRVPQTPLNAVGACASSSIAFCEIAPQMVLDYPGYPATADGAVDGGRRRDAAALADPRRLRSGRADDARQARRDERQPCALASSARSPTASRRSTSMRTARSSAKAARACSSRRSTSRYATSSTSPRSSRAGVRAAKRAARRISRASVSAARTRLIHALELAYRGHGYGIADFSISSRTRPARARTRRPISTTALERAQHRGATAGTQRRAAADGSSARRKRSATATRWAKPA